MSTSQTKTTSDLFKFHPFMALFAAISAATVGLQRGLRSLACHDPQLAVASSIVRRHASVPIHHDPLPWTELTLAQWIGNPGAAPSSLPWLPCTCQTNLGFLHCGARQLDEQAVASGRGGILT